MTVLRFEPMHLRKKPAVIYVKDTGTNLMITKFDINIQRAEEVDGWEDFNPKQKLEVQNYIANLRFIIDKFHSNISINRAYRFSLPEDFQLALVEMAELARKHHIEFDPMSAMLTGLLNHVRTTEKRLNAFEEINILPKLGINLIDDEKIAHDKETRKYTKKIFKHLLSVQNYLGKYASLAKSLYDKEMNLNSTAIVRYAEGEAKPSQWSVSCALALLGAEGVNLNDIMPSNIWVKLWLDPLKFSGKVTNAENAFALYQKTFTFAGKEKIDFATLI
jgi:hypothetical protein